ncbi:uncharacterized protein PGTG_12358 [Puccinia graminis f. sp. tritici CRL 75-36-700-3]|uniref:SAC3/GANP/THP3 conserved domain-containing protein n=1 Tax=Puccinia graminis f. sp. tritici (strain CRL 75-36-700-3 / race SCCL) TaxID=418459 RepID=E3KQ27_PUCGT|nr:uncharacterized protein PGTG_12358 [Puccinia graminis f. sp. tritici CRL 75-36-700-3]EFP86402.2 hypothetical protein PGTG_12358 [Puccinia graminis f. sp. tritici CRL 75-36-700-3]
MTSNSPHGPISEEPSSRSRSDFPDNRFLELKPHRDAERQNAVRQGLIPDPLKPRRLDEALPFLGTCLDMCPEFERHEREYQNNSDRWERYPGTFRIDPKKAVKAFHRPAAGNDQPLPSDVRPPGILKSTLDYLFKTLLAKESLFDTHGFIRDRTRSIRQDFTLQNDRGPIAIECHERIARYHILCLHFLRDKEGIGSYQEQQELEQVRKVLQSLNEFYDDYRGSNCFCPNEAEFRAYYLLTHLRDSDAARATERLPEKVFSDQRLQSALQLQILAQCGNMSRAAGRRPANSPATLNAFTRLFKKVSSTQTSFLNACLLETHFSEIRVSALKALRLAQCRKYGAHVPLVEIARLCYMSLEESYGFCNACGLTMSSGELERCTVELHRHAPFDDKPVTYRTGQSVFITAKGTHLSIIDFIDGAEPAASPLPPVPTIFKAPKSIQRPLTLPVAPSLFSPTFSVVPSVQKSVTVDRSVFSPIKTSPSIVPSPTAHATPLRTLQVSPKNFRSAELTSSRERTKRSASLKSIQASPSFFSATGPTASSSKKSPSGSLPAPSLVPPSPFITQPTQPPVVNHDKAIANLSAELVSNLVESSIAQVAQNTLLKKSMKASAEDKRRTESVISHFSRNIETLVLSEVVQDVVFDLAASSLLAIYHTKRQRALLKFTFQKWMTISRSHKSRLSWKGFDPARVQSLPVGDISSIWNPGSMKKAVSQYLYRKVLSTYQLSIREIRVLVITPAQAPSVQAWLRCKFDIAVGQSRTQSTINEVSFSFELADYSLDLKDISRYDLILVWQEPTEQTSSFSVQLMRILQTRSLCHVCCLGISWQVQQPNAPGNSSGRDGLDQVYLSLDAPEVELEQALQDRWPVPQVNTAMSMNNADRLLPLMHIWRGVHRKAASLLHAYVPVNDFRLTDEIKSLLKSLLIKFSVDVLEVISGYVGRMLHPPDDALLAFVIQTLHISHLSDLQPDNVDRLLSEYQSSLPLGTFSFNLSHLFESQAQLSLVEFFQLFGQHLLAAWLDCITGYLQSSSSTDSDLESSRTSTRVLWSPLKTASAGTTEHAQLRPKLDSSFQRLQRQVVEVFPRPLTLDHPSISDSNLSIRDNGLAHTDQDISPHNKKKRKADRLAELRLLVTQTREGLKS